MEENQAFSTIILTGQEIFACHLYINDFLAPLS